ncbi:MAG: ComEC/Rec2 family competence protein [Cyanobacteriota bacterium]|nr:ComEC/Rec2 family competence protein [Cyanobacteriota bacterium]
MDNIYWLGLAWIGGLLARFLPSGETWGWIWPLLGALLGAGLARRQPRLLRTWLLAGLVGVIAWGYLGFRTPYPAPDDVSLSAPQNRAILVGKLTTDPQTTRSGRQRFWLEAQTLEQANEQSESVTGKVYVTIKPDNLPKQQTLDPGQILKLTGSLYLPSPAQNPGGFDFQKYLQNQGSFAGLSAYEVEILQPASWGGWVWRRRIRAALVNGLGQQQGELLSSMVLGSRAADLDYQIRDHFRQIGLSHVLAASGFQVTLLIGVVLALVKTRSPQQQRAIVLLGLGLYTLLTGLSPPVLRAALMGVAATFALTASESRRKLHLDPLMLLLLAAVVLLIVIPTWVNDLGFQLSFLATLGLMVGVEPISKRLEWLPVGLGAAVAVSLAAQFWTLPLQLSALGQMANYFLVANLITLPFVVVLSVVGFAVCGIALIAPPLGSLLASPLQFLLTPLINLVGWMASWPHATYYAGQVSWLQCVLCYGVFAALTFWGGWRQRVRWQGSLLLVAGILLLPNFLPDPSLQITALATRDAPVLVIQSRQETLLINSGDPETIQQVVLPFLRRQGIRNLDQAIVTSSEGKLNSGWGELLKAGIGVRQFWDGGGGSSLSGGYAEALQAVQSRQIPYQVLQVGQQLSTRSGLILTSLYTNPLVLSLTLPESANQGAADNWLLLGTAQPAVQTTLLSSPQLPQGIPGLWWNGGLIQLSLLQRLGAQTGLVSGSNLEDSRAWFQESGRALFSTDTLGAITWTPQQVQTWQARLD